MSKRTDPVETRFWDKVDKTGDCWIWTAAKFFNGYGQIRINKVALRAHRVAYEWLVGPIPDGLHIDHLCGNRACVNPAHLEPVTQLENNRRAAVCREPKTHCRLGHEYTTENRWMRSDGRYRCKKCMSASYFRRKVAA